MMKFNKGDIIVGISNYKSIHKIISIDMIHNQYHYKLDDGYWFRKEYIETKYKINLVGILKKL